MLECKVFDTTIKFYKAGAGLYRKYVDDVFICLIPAHVVDEVWAPSGVWIAEPSKHLDCRCVSCC